jgi:hypothetical protein
VDFTTTIPESDFRYTQAQFNTNHRKTGKAFAARDR